MKPYTLKGGQRNNAPRPRLNLLPPRSMVGQSALNRSIGVRIPGGQPKFVLVGLSRTSRTSLNMGSLLFFNHLEENSVRVGARAAKLLCGE
jgi:hypothetical protein